jgi:hypothetical protein
MYSIMGSAGYEVVKVRDSDPERFLIVTLDTNFPPNPEGGSGPFSEEEIRTILEKVGVSGRRIGELIQNARDSERNIEDCA